MSINTNENSCAIRCSSVHVKVYVMFGNHKVEVIFARIGAGKGLSRINTSIQINYMKFLTMNLNPLFI